MTSENIKGGFAFAGNPIMIRAPWATNLSLFGAQKYTLLMDGEPFYEGRYTVPFATNISPAAACVAPFIPEAPEDGVAPIVTLETEAQMSRRGLEAVFQYGSQSESYVCHVFPGGVTAQNLRVYAEAGTDPFGARFASYDGNFFLTARSAEWKIVMPESEVYPLSFVAAEAMEITVSAHTGDGSAQDRSYTEQIPRGVYALDIDAFRRKLALEAAVIPSVIDVAVDRRMCCRIVIEREDPSAERYRLKFRNSLGVMEIFAVSGALSVSPETEEDEESSYGSLDPVTDMYVTGRLRRNTHLKAKVETGPMSVRRLRHMLDLLASDDVLLLDYAPQPIKVIPSAENLQIDALQKKPGNVTLTLDFCESDPAVLPDVESALTSGLPRLFSRQFSKQFN